MYQSFIGLEIHIQLLTETKVFCSCRSNFGDEPNSNICPVCMGYPGALPALNDNAMKLSYIVARALNCTLAPECVFERKNYFYPDLPKNYQISQFSAPLGTNGHLDLEFRGRKRRVRIHECHLEEDAGKMIHAGDQSLLDYNRTGTPLLEIVTEPDLEFGEEAEHLLQEFRRMVRYLGVCDGNMEEGSLRCDANVSINTQGAGLGTKVEIKNLNSSRFVRKALNYEIARQEDIVERGGTIVQETRLWNENRDVSESMRVKESSNDYRYFPEPDLPPFRPTPEFLKVVEAGQIEMPRERMSRLRTEHDLSEAQAAFICDERETAEFFEAAVGAGAGAVATASWLMGDVQRLLNRLGLRLADSRLTPQRLAELLTMLDAGRIHGKIAKQVLEAVFSDDASPAAIIAERGWEQVTDRAGIGAIVDQVLAESEQAVEQIRSGDVRPRGYLVGQVMKKSSGRADPALVQEILNQKLAFQVVQVIAFGGAISGSRREDGLVAGGNLAQVIDAAKNDPSLPGDIRYQELALGEFLSEEITPTDWAGLIAAVGFHVRTGGATGIVVSHGTDTLAYTASLLYWLFGNVSVPIVLTASGASGESEEARTSFRHAVQVAVEEESGIHVAFAGRKFSPLNLRFERVPHAGTPGVFRNWNESEIESPTGSGLKGLWQEIEMEPAAIANRLEEAVRQTHIAAVFPGMQSSSLIALMDAGIRYFVLELYDTGTASVGESPYSIRRALNYGQECGALFFCTSQQEGNVDFSDYVTSHELWREGAIPMGTMTTESVYTRLLAVLLTTETDDAERIIRGMQP
jgi:aspartyl-tRNA(Asn)/glutamyl-tRNA(Gln) amidotransferase subunit B